MAKRKPMGKAAAEMMGRRTGAEALAEVTGGAHAAPKARRRERKREAAPAEAEAQPGQRFMVTTIRIRSDQWNALRQAALEQAAQRGHGKADASEVLRSVLDAWMKRAGA